MNICRICKTRPAAVFDYCVVCLEAVREDHRCPDCASIVTVIEGEGLRIDIRHDATYVRWRAKQRDERCCADHPERPRHT
jgi:hypothetical protein